MPHKKKEQKEGPACACGRGDLYDEWLKMKNPSKKKSDKSNDNK